MSEQKQQLFPKIRLVIGSMAECPWCIKFKEETLPMIKAMGIRYQIITEEEHLEVYDAYTYGLPYIGVCDTKGKPLYNHGGFLTLSELLELINDVYDEEFPGHEKNQSVS